MIVPIRYLRTSDGAQLGWAEAGRGPLLIKTGTWLTDLDHDVASPVWRHWVTFFSDHFRFVRYDERGCGMTEWNVSDLSLERWVEDLESVVAAVQPVEPFVLVGVSHGAAIAVAYAVRHPEQVSRLVLWGGFAQGAARRGDPAGLRLDEAIVELVRSGWTKDNPAFRQVFTSRFVPGATDEQLAWFNDLCTRVTSPANAAALMTARALIDVSALLERVETPTLILHASGDQVVPISQGRLLASAIPNAQFLELDSRNHILLEKERAWSHFCAAVLDFTGSVMLAEHVAFASLSTREREVLALVAKGLGNAEIAERLSISEKTVRNHMSHLYDKLGVWTRARAIVFARDRGFARQT